MFETNYVKLRRRSTDIMSVFTKTVSDLVVVNEAIDDECVAIGETISVLMDKVNTEQAKTKELIGDQKKNKKVIAKITQFLEE